MTSGLLSSAGQGRSLRRPLRLRSWALGHAGCSGCGPRAHWLRCKRLACPKHLGSSQSRDRTGVTCVASWTLHPWTTREAQQLVLKPFSFQTHLFRSGDRYPSSLVTHFRRHQCADAERWRHSQPAAVNRQSKRPLRCMRASGPPWVHAQMEDPGRSVGCRQSCGQTGIFWLGWQMT